MPSESLPGGSLPRFLLVRVDDKTRVTMLNDLVDLCGLSFPTWLPPRTDAPGEQRACLPDPSPRNDENTAGGRKGCGDAGSARLCERMERCAGSRSRRGQGPGGHAVRLAPAGAPRV